MQRPIVFMTHAGGPLTIDLTLGRKFLILLNGDVTPAVSFITGHVVGQTYQIIFKQDEVGGRTITWPVNSFWYYQDDVPPVTDTDPGALTPVVMSITTLGGPGSIARVWKSDRLDLRPYMADMAVAEANGGYATDASKADTDLSNLIPGALLSVGDAAGLAPKTYVEGGFQPLSANLGELAAVDPGAEGKALLAKETAADALTELGVSAFMQTALDDPTASALRLTTRPRYGLLAAETATAIEAFTAEPRRAVTNRLDDLISGLVDAGIWAKLDFVMAPGLVVNEQAGLLDLKNPTRGFTKASGATFTANRGIVGGGAGIATSTFAMAGGQFAQNSASMGVVLRTDRAGATESAIASVALSTVRLRPRDASNTLAARINDGGGIAGPASTTTIGFFADSRLLSTEHDVYFGGSAASAPTKTNIATASTTGVPANNWALGHNVGGDFEDAEMSFAFAGGGLTQTEINTMFTLVKAALQSSGSWA